MSIKIYEAYRVPCSKLNNFIDVVRERVLNNLEKRITSYMETMEIPEMVPLRIDKNDIKTIEKWKQIRRFNSLIDNHLDAEKKGIKDVFSLDCGLNIWIVGKYAYVVPINCHKISYPKYAKDYCYWDNVDVPKNISYSKWLTREKMWKKINCGEGTADHNSRRLYHAIVDLSGGIYSGTFELKQRILLI